MASKTAPHNVPVSAFSLFSKSSEIVQNNLSTFAVLYIVPLLGNLSRYDDASNKSKFSNFSFNGIQGGVFAGLLGIGIVFIILFAVLTVISSLMLIVLQLRTAENKKPSLGETWQETKKFGWRLILLGLKAGIYIVFGLILFIVPGLIMLRRYYLSAYVLIDKDVSVKEAMERSAAMSKPHSGAIWGLIGVTILIAFTGAIPLIGWAISFVLGALYSVAPALRYLELKKLPVTKAAN